MRRDRGRAGPRPRAARRRGRLQRGRARPVRRRGARGGQPRAPGGDGARRGPRAGHGRGHGCRDVDAIAVTAGPGLAGALLVGVCAAKAYALALGKPLYGVNHLAAHIAVDQLEHGPLPAPVIALLVSGGHSSLLLVPDLAGRGRAARRDHRRRGGRGLRQGGPAARAAVSRRPADRRGGARRRPGGVTFPRGQVPGPDLRLLVLRPEDRRWPAGSRPGSRQDSPVPVADVAASFQEAVADVLTRKAVDACRAHGVGHLVIGGGVAANSRLRALAEERCDGGRHPAAGAAAGAVHRQRRDGRRARRRPRRARRRAVSR